MKIRRPMCCVAVCFLLFVSILIEAFHFIPINYDAIAPLEDGDDIVCSGCVYDINASEEKTVIYLKRAMFIADGISDANDTGDTNAIGDDYGFILYMGADDKALPPIGSRVTACGRIYRFDTAENYGQFNSAQYYYIRGYHARIMNGSILSCDNKYGLREYLYRLKERIKGIYKSYLNDTDSGIMSAIMLGDKTELEPEIKSLYQDSGISHILCLSGLHIATLGLALHKLLTQIIRSIFIKSGLCGDYNTGGRRSILAAGVISTAVMLMYCIMTGMNVSTIRAFIMYVLGLMATICNRTYDLLSAAALSSVAVVMINPLYIYDAGFRLSFSAVVSIGIIYPRLVLLFKRAGENKIIQALLISISIQMGGLPITAYHYYKIPLYGIVLNLVVVPLMSVVLVCGVVITVSGLIFGTGNGLLNGAAVISGKITHVILTLYEQLSGLAVAGNGTFIIGKPGKIQIFGYYLMLIAIITAIDMMLRREEERDSAPRRSSYVDQSGRRFIGHKRINGCLVKRLILCGFSMMTCVTLTTGHHKEYMIHNLSVGQGDCTVIRNKTHVIIADCGSTTENDVGTYRLIPFLEASGISKIDVIFISHFDSDHVNGILELLQDDFYKKRIDKIIISGAALNFDAETDNYTELIEDSITCDIPIYTMYAGESVTACDSLISCLSPVKEYIDEYSDTNSASLVLDVTDRISGFRTLITGDMDIEAEGEMYRERLGYNYLKVAHHGSDTSTSDSFLQNICRLPVLFSNENMEILHYTGEDYCTFNNYNMVNDTNKTNTDDGICVISVGKNNRYGHPRPELLSRLKTYYSEGNILRTDDYNEIMVKVR